MEQQQPNINIHTETAASSTDHDLLLTIKAEMGTKLDRVISDVKDLNDNFAGRVNELENDKLDKDAFKTYCDQDAKEFTEYKTTKATEFEEYKSATERDFEQYKKDTKETIDDHEDRIRYTSKWLYYGFGFIAAIDAFLIIYQIYKTTHP